MAQTWTLRECDPVALPGGVRVGDSFPVRLAGPPRVHFPADAVLSGVVGAAIHLDGAIVGRIESAWIDPEGSLCASLRVVVHEGVAIGPS